MPHGVGVVIPFRNDLAELRACLESVMAQTEAPSRVIIVNNGSGEDLVSLVREMHLPVQLIRNQSNLGFSIAVNQGLKQCSEELVLILNTDVELDPSYIENAAASLVSSERVAGVTGKLLKTHDRRLIDSTGHTIFTDRRVKDRGEWEVDEGQYDDRLEVFSIPATAALYRRAALLEAEMVSNEFLDEDLFSYYEDVDIAWRLHHLGWRFAYVPTATAIHKRSISNTTPNTHTLTLLHRNRILVMLKNDSGASVFRHLPALFLTEFRMCVFYLLYKRPLVPLLVIAGFLRSVPRTWAKRRTIQESKPRRGGLESWFETYDYWRILRPTAHRLGEQDRA